MRRAPLRVTERRKRRIKIFVSIFAVLVLVLMFDNSVRPLMKRIAESRARIVSEKAINAAIAEVLSDGGFDYSDLVTVTALPDGEMSSIRTDIVKVNKLKAAVSEKIQEKMSEGEPGELRIPIGSLTGSEFFNGRGPKITLKLNFYGNVFTDLQSEFSDAGINQTRHQIMLSVKTSVFIEMPGYNTSTEVHTNFCIAETVIVGRVPETYTVVNGDDSSDISLMNDYSK